MTTGTRPPGRRETPRLWSGPRQRPGAQGITDTLSEARDTQLTRLQRVALANRLVNTVDRLERAGSAHPALYEMANEVHQVLGPLSTVPAPAHPDEQTTPLRTDIGNTRKLASGPNSLPREPEPTYELGLEI